MVRWSSWTWPAGRVDGPGFGMVGIILSLLVMGLLSVVAVSSLGSGGAPGDNSSSLGGSSLGGSVALAYDTEAQSKLSDAERNIRDAMVTDASASAPDLTQFGVTTGPSTGPSTVSGAAATGGLGADGATSGSGSVTLAVSSKSGTCWLVWFSASSTWYGAEPRSSSCQAQPMANPPSPSTPSDGSVGWQQGSFPSS